MKPSQKKKLKRKELKEQEEAERERRRKAAVASVMAAVYADTNGRKKQVLRSSFLRLRSTPASLSCRSNGI